MPIYDAFISYSHAKDKPIATALQSVIQKLGKPWYRRRALRVFRDDTSLSATPGLWPTIQQSLEQSRFLILLASPEAAASPWVNKELAYWLERKGADTLFIAVTDGELVWDVDSGDFGGRAPLPPAAKGCFLTQPRWVDLTAYREGADKREAKFTELAANFAAAIRGMPKEDLLSQEVRQQGRALTLAWSAATTLLLLAVAAGTATVFAYRAQKEAILQRDRAEQTLAAATQTANSLVFSLAQRFRDTVGVPAALVKDILDQARALQDQLIKSGQVTPDLKRSEAAALDAAARSLIAIGDIVGALSSAKQGQQIIADLLTGYPANTNLQHSLSVSLNTVGDVQMVQGDRAGALQSYRDSLAVIERLAKTDPGNTDWQRDRSVMYSRVGNMQVAQGDLAGALQSYQDSLAIRDQLAKSDPDNTGWQRDLGMAYSRIGDVQATQGDRAGALQSYRDSLAIHGRLAKTDPGNAVWQLDLSVALQKIGDVQGLASALQSYRDSLAVIDRLANSDPGNAVWQAQLSFVSGRIGDVQVQQGDRAGALQSYRDSLVIMDRLAKADPDNAESQRELSVSIEKIGDVQVQQGDLAGALQSYRDSLAIADRLAKSDPGNADWQHDLMVSLNKVGDVHVGQGDLAGALQSYRAASQS
jgi:tetratricopeptide (TPR) repeat protein